MAYRDYITVNWNSSPRIITVAAPYTELVIQDLHDTLQVRLSEMVNSSYNPIISSGGKERLDDVTKVTVTSTLLNAIVGFEARSDWTQCKISGGNLVAIDDLGNDINPINPTSFVNIDRTSSSSGTLQEQDALNYSSYQNAVWLDEINGNDSNLGNREFPVKSASVAVAIGLDKGFNELRFVGNFTLGQGDDVTGFTLVGSNPTRTLLTLGDAAIIDKVEIREASVTGTLDGNAILRECAIYTINYFSGYMYNCVLTSDKITLGNNAVALLLNCYSGVPGSNTPIIDMGGSGQSLGLRNYNGGIKLINKTGIDGLSLDMNAGQVIIGSDFTGDPAYLRGVYKLLVETGGTPPITDGRAANFDDTASKIDVINAGQY